MSEKRIFQAGYIETRQVAEYHRAIDIDISNYPELEGKTDSEVIEYIKENAGEMSPQDDFYDSLEDELMDQDVIRDKDWGLETEIWVELPNLSVLKQKDGDEDSDEDDEEYDDE